MTETPVDSKRLIILIVAFCLSQSAIALAGTISDEGLNLYKKKCSWCHGLSGRGDGPASKFISPAPRNFTLGLNKFVSTAPAEITLPSDDDIFRTISNGLPGTAMMPWQGVLSEEERWKLVNVVKGFSDIFDFEAPPKSLTLTERVPATAESLKKGRFLFRSAGCFECHGEEGRGDGNKLLRGKSGKRVWPRNLTKPWTFKGGSRPEDIFRRVSAGLPGTPMPAFGLAKNPDNSLKRRSLTEEERWNLVNFVLSLKDENYSNPDTIIRALHLEGDLPGSIADRRWKKAPWTSFHLSPNLIKGEKLFTPLNDIIRVKALFNDSAITLMLTWSDRTKSLPLGRHLEDLGGEELFEDAVAVQFPIPHPASRKRRDTYLAHGNPGRGIRGWMWKGGTMETGQTATGYSGEGVAGGLLPARGTPPLASSGVYENGEWQVIIREDAPHSDKIFPFKPGDYLPIAFATWDGSNGERGSKHSLTRWGNLYLTPPEDRKKFFLPASVLIIMISIQVGVRRRLSSPSL